MYDMAELRKAISYRITKVSAESASERVEPRLRHLDRSMKTEQVALSGCEYVDGKGIVLLQIRR